MVQADLRLSYALVVQYFVFALLAALSRAISQGLVLFFQVLSLMSLYVAMYGLLLLFKATRRIIPRQECQLGKLPKCRDEALKGFFLVLQ